MRTLLPAIVVGLISAAGTFAQPAILTPPAPAPVVTPSTAPPMTSTAPSAVPTLPTLPKLPAPPPAPMPMPEFGVEQIPGTIVSDMSVRPPMPVGGMVIEVPPGPRVWMDFDYLMWRAKGGLLPALVTASPASAGPVPSVASAYMVNDNRINGDLREGVRIGAGVWVDKPNGTGLEAVYTHFFRAEDVATYTGSPDIFLSRPFWDVNLNAQSLFILSMPNGPMSGVAQVQTSFDSRGLELNMWRRGPAMFSEEFHWIMGLRFWEMEEDLTVISQTRTGPLAVSIFDTFATRNQFYGGQVGGRFNFTRNKLSFDLITKIAAGVMVQEATIFGGTTVSLPGVQLTRPGGFLALSSNSGTHKRAKFAVIRDTSFNVSYCLMENLSLHAGLDFIYVQQVVRPGEQTDLGINPNLLPFSATPPSGPERPGFRFNQEIFYMYGFHFGVRMQF